MLNGKQRAYLRSMSQSLDTIFQIGKGGITEEGTRVVYEGFPKTADLMFEKTLEKRRLTSERAEKIFSGQ